MGKKSSVIVSQKDIETRLKDESDAFKPVIYKSQNVYLSAFLISQENFKLGKVYIEDLSKDNKAWIEVEYDPKFEGLLNNYLDVFKKNKAIVNLNNYQQNIRFIMHLVNKRKSGLED